MNTKADIFKRYGVIQGGAMELTPSAALSLMANDILRMQPVVELAEKWYAARAENFGEDTKSARRALEDVEWDLEFAIQQYQEQKR